MRTVGDIVMSIRDGAASVAGGDSLRAPDKARRRADRLIGKRDEHLAKSRLLADKLARLNEYLALGEKVTVALERLNEQLFQQLLRVVQEKLTIALQEILDQPIKLRADAEFKRGAATVEFWIERAGNREDVLRGQGGSVTNILSVGLRMFALTTLDETRHRRFLVLDEQDCWLRPDLVPKLVKIVHDAGHALGFQILMISHHDVALFERYADRIFQLVPRSDGSVEVHRVFEAPPNPDPEETDLA
jgi:ABC-type glutathione transport system ATPase component